MKLHYSVVNKAGHTFAVVLVEKTLLTNRDHAREALDWLQHRKLNMPTSLISCDNQGTPTGYFGPTELALLLLHVPLTKITWHEIPIS
jgi:signal recognition particle receptor subunit beta